MSRLKIGEYHFERPSRESTAIWACIFTWYTAHCRMNAALWRDVTWLKRQLALIQAETERSHCDVSQWQEVITCKNFTSHCPHQLDVFIRYITYKIYRQTLRWQNMLHVGTTRQNLQPTKATYTPVATISWPRASSAQISGHIHVTTCIYQRLYDQLDITSKKHTCNSIWHIIRKHMIMTVIQLVKHRILWNTALSPVKYWPLLRPSNTRHWSCKW